MMKPRLSIFSAPRGLGSIFSEQNQINVKVLETSVIGGSTDTYLAYNLGGKKRIIVVQGAHSGEHEPEDTNDERLQSFIAVMETWINANIQDTQIYYDSIGNNYDVKAIDWTWTRSLKDPKRILYSLMMVETGI